MLIPIAPISSKPNDFVEVAQQTKARHRDDFVVAFSPIIAEAVATAYKGASADIQQRIKRVVDVWRERAVFETPILEAIEARVQGNPPFPNDIQISY